MKSMMVDIETLSTREDAAVVAIGAVIFNAEEILDRTEILIDPAWATGHRDSRTYRDFWMNRSEVPEHVYRRMLSGALTSWEACGKFIEFHNQHRPKQCWANPPQFDLVILRNMFRGCGMERHFPVHYKAERDCRTLWNLAKAHGLGPKLQHTREGLDKHNALHDAIAQARAVQIINRELV